MYFFPALISHFLAKTLFTKKSSFYLFWSQPDEGWSCVIIYLCRSVHRRYTLKITVVVVAVIVVVVVVVRHATCTWINRCQLADQKYITLAALSPLTQNTNIKSQKKINVKKTQFWFCTIFISLNLNIS